MHVAQGRCFRRHWTKSDRFSSSPYWSCKSVNKTRKIWKFLKTLKVKKFCVLNKKKPFSLKNRRARSARRHSHRILICFRHCSHQPAKTTKHTDLVTLMFDDGRTCSYCGCQNSIDLSQWHEIIRTVLCFQLRITNAKGSHTCVKFCTSKCHIFRDERNTKNM